MDKQQIQVKSLRRIFYLLKILQDEIEYLAMDEGTDPNKRKKLLKTYNNDRIKWVYVDLLTSTLNQESRAVLTSEMNSEHLKSVAEWIDLGIECQNIDELMEILKTCSVKVEA